EDTFDASRQMPPASVTNLRETATGTNWVHWEWTNPTDADFSHVMIYIDGVFVTTTPNNQYNATGFLEGTVHTIGIQTVDTAGNINPATMTDQATTSTDTTPPAPVTDLYASSIGESWIHWTWTNPNDADFSHVIVYIDDWFVTSTSNNFYRATRLRSGVEHTIAIETVDTSGNVNTAQVSNTVVTTKTTTTVRTLVVDGSGSQPYTTIQEAVDAANDGDTILVYPGDYNENVHIYKRLNILSQSGASNTRVSALELLDTALYVDADDVSISGFTVSGCVDGSGIVIGDVQNCLISNNLVNVVEYGIVLYGSDNIITDTSVQSECGIVLYGSDNMVTDTSVQSGTYGIILDGSNNMVTDTSVQGGTYGIFIDGSDNILSHNNIHNNYYGIRVSGSDNILTSNIIYDNYYYGISVSGLNNLIYKNYLANHRSHNSLNAFDDGFNFWDNGQEGNYYSDYTGVDRNNDGIGDTPYLIPGGVGIDHYPLMRIDTTPPASVTDLRETATGTNWIHWEWTNPTDTDFDHVRIYIDGSFVTTTPSNSYNATGFLEGTVHTIDVQTVDTAGNINPANVTDQATTMTINTTDTTPPASVTNLRETATGTNWIHWTWKNPADTDFSHVMVYLDNVFVTNTPNGSYYATGLGDVYISDLNLKDEWVKIMNSGSFAVDLTGWEIKDEGDIHTYKFPSFQLGAGEAVTLYTTKGTNTGTELYWGSGGFVWNDDGDTAYLYNSGGYLLDSLKGGATHTMKATSHVLSTRTVDISGNINTTWVNDSATTSSSSSSGSSGGS
uniref:NosD domain-containing protein n=1 Tax=Methanomethylovorans sp. TaxID=2758717 RepID=UPI001BD391C9